MLRNARHTLTPRTSSHNHQNCTPKKVAKIKVFQFAILLCCSLLLLHFLHATAVGHELDYIATNDSDDLDQTLLFEINPINLTFASDGQEPAPMEPTAPNDSTSFSDWLGVWGKSDDKNFMQDNLLGLELSDYKFHSLKEGSGVKFSAARKSLATTTGWQSPAMNVRIKQYRADMMDVSINGEALPTFKIGGIRKVSTQYKPIDSKNFISIENLVPGKVSQIDISIANYGSQIIATTLVYGLSVDNGPIKIVGTTKLNLTPDNISHIYRTTLTTPADTQDTKQGDLVAVLYGSANEDLDTYTTKIDIWSQRREYMLTVLYLLMENHFGISSGGH